MFFRLGLRNLKRRGWRSFLTCLMIAAGCFMVTSFVGLAEGTYGLMIRLATQTYMGHFQVLKGDYQTKPSLFKNLPEPEKIRQELKSNAAIKAVSFRVEAPGLLSYQNQTVGGMLVGVEPEAEKKVTTIAATVVEGDWVESAKKGLPVVLGVDLAKRLKVSLGQEISFVGQAADGSTAAELFVVTGLIKTGSEMDRGMGFIRLQDAQELLVMQGRVHRIVGVTHRFKDAVRLGDTPLPKGINLQNWQQLMPELYQTIKTDRQGDYIFHSILMLVVLLGVGNTMAMAVMERSKEFGVLLALGTSPGQIIKLTLSEAAWISLIGVAFGLAAGTALNAWIAKNGLPIPTDPISFGGVVIDRYSSANTVLGNVIFPTLIFLGGVLAGLMPAIKASKLNPVDALRTA